MVKEFEQVTNEIISLLDEWEPRLRTFTENTCTGKRNSQNRNIKQILGHLIDSASNNTHRTVHLQYQKSPFRFPNYASEGNNDRWIAIQHYETEDWQNMIDLWKSSNLHLVHVIRNVDATKLDNQWYASEDRLISLKDCIIDYLRHFRLHLDEIDGLNH